MDKTWKELYDNDNPPGPNALDSFWPTDIRRLFIEFSNDMNYNYKLLLNIIVYSKTYGWKFKLAKNRVVLINNIIIVNDAFYVDKICVKNELDLKRAEEFVLSLYTNAFIAESEKKITKRKRAQAERSRQRMEQESNERESFSKKVGKDKFNQFRWANRISRRLLVRLYESDAKMMLDDELLDEVGFTIYTRCLQGRDESILFGENKMKCHNCGAILTAQSRGELLTCDCGHSYLLREYKRSFVADGMPSRSATIFFNEFIDKWPTAKDSTTKMQLIDWVIHQCHQSMQTGVKSTIDGKNFKFAGINIIEGSPKQVAELITHLAYGDSITEK